jgi:hypothetical protein
MLSRALIALSMTVAVLGQSCAWLASKHYKSDNASPTGIYRVKVDVTVKDEGGLSGRFTSQGGIQVFKGTEIVYSQDLNYSDTWESTFMDDHPVIEWVGNNALRMGGDISREPFTNELVVWNDTPEHFKEVGITFSKYESFHVFDLIPGAKVILQVAPGSDYDSSGDQELSFGYGGQTQSGKAFQDAAAPQKHPNHSVKLQIRIKPEDIN